MARMPRILFIIAAVWSVIAGVIIFFFSGGGSVTSETGTQTVQHLNWYESQGWWGVAILFIFAALYYGPLHFYKRGQRGMATLFGLVTIVLTVLAGFSIGFLYLPGAAAVLFALVLLPFQARSAK
jgi:ABC-type long-subunit fatty acid transport system fused permease/ATPase subunit